MLLLITEMLLNLKLDISSWDILIENMIQVKILNGWQTDNMVIADFLFMYVFRIETMSFDIYM